MGNIRRNAPCTCGSGKKYKHCHGSFAPGEDAQRQVASRRVFAELEAKEARRLQQQGLGNPIVSFESNGYRFVAVGDTLHCYKNCKTFHDFLFEYIKDAVGREWGAKEQSKPLAERHVLMRWNYEIGEYHKTQKQLNPTSEIIFSAATPVLRAYLGLAYNLYLIRHNAVLQRTLVARLKSRDESAFYGAYYETFVAAAFIRAGFDLAFENEQDGTSSHCEFVATSRTSGREYSVEAKSRFRGHTRADVDPANLELGVWDKVENALGKHADHERVIFVDVNLPEKKTDTGQPHWVPSALDEVRDLENTIRVAGRERRQAYVIVTNNPCLFDNPGGLSAILEGFDIPELKAGGLFPSLRAALDARDRHQDMHRLFELMKTHYDIPSTFDGEMPELHFSEERSLPLLQIGNRYLVPNQQGVEMPAELVEACVLESEKLVHGMYRFEDGVHALVTCPLTDAELAAYKKYPDTFFGVVKHVGRKPRDLIDWYDFFFESYRNTPKDRLLEFMKDASDIDALKVLSQDELAQAYCERLAYGVGHLRDAN
jgi:SEC-C motif